MKPEVIIVGVALFLIIALMIYRAMKFMTDRPWRNMPSRYVGPCFAVQCSDQGHCPLCNLTWDGGKSDPDKPACNPRFTYWQGKPVRDLIGTGDRYRTVDLSGIHIATLRIAFPKTGLK